MPVKYNLKIVYNLLTKSVNPIRPMIKHIKNNSNNDLIGVEIGVRSGKNSLNILKNLNIKRLYLIDPYLKYDDIIRYSDKKHINQKQQDNYFKKAKKRLKKYQNKIIFIKEKSKDAINKIPDNLDFVYIDGDHKKAREDLELYIDKLKKNGVIGGHDIRQYLVALDIIGYCIDNNIKPNKFKIDFPDWYLIKK
jgi:hypothetical protein